MRDVREKLSLLLNEILDLFRHRIEVPYQISDLIVATTNSRRSPDPEVPRSQLLSRFPKVKDRSCKIPCQKKANKTRYQKG